MLKVHRRIEKLELALGLSGRFKPYVCHINFIDSDGRRTGTMVVSDDPNLREEYRCVFEKNRVEGA
jgi:hypothetical protein